MKREKPVFEIGDNVTVVELKRPAIVRAVQYDTQGITYRVSFWSDGERHELWVYADEIVGKRTPPESKG